MLTRRAIRIAAILALAGCDGVRDAPATTRPARLADAPVPTSVAMTTLGTLPADRPTQLAALADGEAYALQQSDAPAAAVTRAADGRATTLTPQAIVRALGVAGGAGQILAIAARDDGKLAFAFVGDAPRPTTSDRSAAGGSLRLAAIGTWDPATSRLFVAVDQLALADVDDAFADVATLRPTLIVDGDDAWLWRTTDAGTMRLLTIRGLSRLRPTIVARDATIATTGDAAERRAGEWSPTDDAGRFLWADAASRQVRSLDARGASVVAGPVARFDGPNVASITPPALDAAGRTIVLARDADGAVRSLLVQDGDAVRAIDASRFTLDGRPIGSATRIDRLVPVPGRPGEFVAYDAASGRVVRVTVS